MQQLISVLLASSSSPITAMVAADFIIPYAAQDLPLGVSQAVPIAYYVLCGLGFIIILASFGVQFSKPANYGKFDPDATPADKSEEKEKKPSSKNENDQEQKLVQQEGGSTKLEVGGSGCRVSQRIAHFCSDFPPGVLVFTSIFFAATRQNEKRSDPSYVMLACWLAHYVHRGIITPLTMNYSSADVDAGILFGGLFPNMMFSTAVALHISVVDYDSLDYFRDPRFGIGLALFIIGYFGNRWSDYHLKNIRKSGESEGLVRKGKYLLPKAFLFKLCFCPNYFFEFVEWSGFAILTSSLAGVLWALFGLSTFLPRSLATKKWYLKTFEGDADKDKAALFPFIL